MIPQGDCDPRFAAVAEAFAVNFTERGEVGASACVMIDGRPVADLWGGAADPHAGAPWQRDTVGLVWSCTKGAVALCLHILASRGKIDFDAPVSRYWPEFAQAGKDHTSVAWLLSHQAGIPVARTPLRPGGLYDWQYMIDWIAAEAPVWEPGTRVGYHAATFGHLVGELVRRIDGRDIGKFFREEVAGPLGIDFHIGLPLNELGRVAPTIRADPTPSGDVPWRFLAAVAADPKGIAALVARNTGRRPGLRDHDSPEALTAVLPSQGGVTNARGLAGMYAPLSLGKIIDADTLHRATEVQSAAGIDAVLLVGVRWGLGWMRSSDNRKSPPGATDSVILGAGAFGHAGMGGSLGFADPAAKLSFGYTMNKQGRGVLLNERGQALVDAIYESLGCRSNVSGAWR